MIKSIAFLLIVIVFGLLVLSLTALVLASLGFSLAAVIYRVIPGPNVPLNYNLRNIRQRWLTTLFTAVAFTMVIGPLVFMMAFVNGMNTLTENSGRPGNVMLLKSGSTDESFSDLPSTADVLRLPSDTRNQILKNNKGEWLATKEVYLIVNQPIPNAPPSGKQRRFVQMRGIDNPVIAAQVHGIVLQEGRWFSQQGVQSLPSTAGTVDPLDLERSRLAAAFGLAVPPPNDRAIEVVIGAGIAQEFGRDRPGGGAVGLGEILSIGPRKWVVVGIMSTSNSTFSSEVWCRDYLVQELFGRRNSYSTYVVATKNAVTAEKMSRDLKDFKELAVNALPETEYYSKLSATNKQFLYGVLVMAIIMAIAGVLGVMITMFAAISQRAKDIGVLRLLGFSRWQIVVSFLLESLALALLGGLLGCALGSLCHGWTATSIVSSGQGGGGKSVILKLVVDAQTIGIAMLFTFIMGAVGGLVPALSAMRLKPLESLR
jgi:ABC-type lipoprotein release transport system permease subunit